MLRTQYMKERKHSEDIGTDGRQYLNTVFFKTPDDGQGNCPKHVEFHARINF